jgi:ribonuclease P/MRP protein subunit RPP1
LPRTRTAALKGFADLHLPLPISDHKQVETLIRRSAQLGYNLVGIPFPPNAEQDRIDRIRAICTEAGIDLATRVDLNPKTTHNLIRHLRTLRRKFELISVMCTSKPIARQAAKDRRVDLLSFAKDPRERFFDLAEARLASKTSASLEIDMAPLLSLNSIPRIRLLSRLRREVETAKKFGVPIVVSSGARNSYLLKSPYDYAALTFLFDLPSPLRMPALSETPLAIVKRNRSKLGSDYVAPGIRIVKRGKDC